MPTWSASQRSRATKRRILQAPTHGSTLVRVKLAASLDARTALADGNSAWITGSAARLDVQWLRARACAVLSGSDTVLNDDPSLTVRIDRAGQPCAEAKSDIPQPLRVIVDGRCRVTSTAKTFHLPGEVLIATTDTGRLPSLPYLPAQRLRCSNLGTAA